MEQMDKFDKEYSKSMQQLTSNIRNSIAEGFTVSKQLIGVQIYELIIAHFHQKRQDVWDRGSSSALLN